MTDAVLGNTYDLDAADFAKLRRDTVDRKLAGRVGDPVDPVRTPATATRTSSPSRRHHPAGHDPRAQQR